MGIDNGSVKIDAKQLRQMTEGYRSFLAANGNGGSPREAHVYALAMKNKGVTFNRSVAEVIMELEGRLPSYWNDKS